MFGSRGRMIKAGGLLGNPAKIENNQDVGNTLKYGKMH